MKVSEIFLSLRVKLRRALLRQFVWVASSRQSLDGTEYRSSAPFVVLGREYYDERRKAYAIRSWRGLYRALRLETGFDAQTIFSIGPLTEAGRQVTFFRLKPEGLTAISEAIFCLPESLAITSCLDERELAIVRRGNLEYYISHGCASQIRGGAIKDVQIFRLSAGLPEDASIKELSVDEVAAALRRAIWRISPLTWFALLVSRDRWLRRWPPKVVASATAIALVVYLGLASIYLESLTWIRERQLSALGGDVNLLLTKQRGIDRAITELAAIDELDTQRTATYRLWGIVSEVWRVGGAITSAQLEGYTLTLQGSSETSLRVLEALSKLPQVRGARFESPVRAVEGAERFVIVLTLSQDGAG